MTSGGETAAPTENRLGDASSPYLLQHADNPVAWRPWGDEAFREARERDVPVFVSIGYSTCHWCHVMARESFQDPEVAELLNRHFVAVKVDREERPDVDAVYMTACQMMTGGGGWPLSVFVTPDREPFFAGTYFPKESRGGRPGFVEILDRIASLWENRREDLLEQAGKLTEGLKRAAGDTSAAGAGAAAGQPADEDASASARIAEGEAAGRKAVERKRASRELDEGALEEAYRTLERRYDDLQGGFGSAPKFPAPQNLIFLLRHWHRTGRHRALEMVEGTLEGMRRGGVYDQVGFGFHRYSTDSRWHLPHFEKMLYDQALLAYVYAESGLATGRADFARTAREVLTYVLRDLRDPEGGFHSAEDADSEGPDGEHGEGKFYVWTEAELREVLGEEDFLLAKDVWDTREAGNFAEEATGRRTGENVLHLRASIPELARSRGMEPEELEERLESIRRRLYEAREQRPRPHLDDKVLTDWNGLAVAALARAGTILGDEEFVDAGREAADFVLETLRDGEGTLLHRYRAGEAGVPAVADDYAFLIWGLLELHDATLEPRWLREALELEEEFVRRLWDGEAGGFYLSGPEAGELPARQRSAHDGAMPSANGVAAWNAVRLARLTGRAELEERVLEVERAFGEGARRAPAAHVALLLATDFRLGEGREVVLGGRRGTRPLEALLEVLREEFRPRTVVLFRPSDEDEPEVAGLAPFTREMRPAEDGVAAWVCRDFVCRAPVTEPEALRRELAGRDESR